MAEAGPGYSLPVVGAARKAFVQGPDDVLMCSVCTGLSAEQLHEKRSGCTTPGTASSTQEQQLKEPFERDLRHLAPFAVVQR